MNFIIFSFFHLLIKDRFALTLFTYSNVMHKIKKRDNSCLILINHYLSLHHYLSLPIPWAILLMVIHKYRLTMSRIQFTNLYYDHFTILPNSVWRANVYVHVTLSLNTGKLQHWASSEGSWTDGTTISWGERGCWAKGTTDQHDTWERYLQKKKLTC